MDDIPSLQEQWERDWRGPGDALRMVQKHARGTLIAGSAPRVNLLDAGVLDEQVETLLLERLKKELLSNVADPSTIVSLTPELLLAIRTIIWFATIGRCGTSYGMDLQNVSIPRLTKTSVKVLHYALSVIVPWAWTRFTRLIAQSGWWHSPDDIVAVDEDKSDDTSAQKWKHMVWQIVQILDKAYTVASVVNFAVFLWRGDYPTVTSRVLRAGIPTQRNPVMRRTLLYGQMKRQLFWEGLTETTLVVMPLLLSPSVRRSVNTVINRVTSAFGFRSGSPSSKERREIAEGGCALCGETPARTAYVSNDDDADCSNRCVHTFCYLCAYRELAMSPGHTFECPVCHLMVSHISRASAVTDHKQ